MIFKKLGKLFVKGALWALDHPDEVKKVLAAVEAAKKKGKP